MGAESRTNDASGVISTDAVNVRNDATTGGSVLTTLVNGDGMTVVAAADDYTWHSVEAADGTTGCVVGESLAAG